MEVVTFENKRWEKGAQSMEFRHVAAMSLIKDAKVLDVGCGDGLLLSLLKEKGIEAEGIDLSQVAVDRGVLQGLKIIEGDFADNPLPFKNDSFSTVVALDVLEHLYEPNNLLKEMTRVSSSSVVIGVPNFSSLPARLQTLIGRVPQNNFPHKGHIYWFNWEVLAKMASAAGLVMEEIKMNVFWERRWLIGRCVSFLARIWPNLFALSFVIRFSKAS